MGSTFKTLTLAMALDSGKANLNTLYDARGALHYGKFAIHDTHALGRSITLSGSVHLLLQRRRGAGGAEPGRRSASAPS